jgi:lipopolysaccharide transport system ATP-binding protein
MSDIAIKVEDISKLYRLGKIGTGSFKNDLRRLWYQVKGKEDPFAKIGAENDRTKKAESEWVWALKDINFEVKKGNVLGIIGRNGAGKSTLLKILSKITAPTTGQITINGRIASLLEVGTGFHPELSGRENIFLNGAILGMKKEEIRKKFDEIVDFAGVEAYIDTPVKRYSSGMYVRLAFAVAAYLEPEILIVDEVLAVGDSEFQKKCLGRMHDVSVNDGRTVLFVSHNLGAVSNLCSSAILMEMGKLTLHSSTQQIIKTYLDNNNNYIDTIYSNNNSESNIYLSLVKLYDINQKNTNDFTISDHISIYINLFCKDDYTKYNLIVTILDSSERPIMSSDIKIYSNEMILRMPPRSLVRGKYFLKLIIYIPAVSQYDIVDKCCGFNILDDGSEMAHLDKFDYGVVFADNLKWV